MRQYIPEIESGGLSVTGPVRGDNQDSIHLPNRETSIESGLLFAIADGMGGYAYGGIASLLALEAFASTLITQNGSTPIIKTLRRGIETANLQVYQKAQQLGAGRMGTTLTAAYILGDKLYLAHVGDSRAYLIRSGRAVCLSADHTTVGDMVRNKLLSPDKLRTHAQRSILTKAIGVSLFIQPDITEHRLQEDDHLILCSDGVWSAVADEDFVHAVASMSSMEKISQRLVELAIQNDTDDNASVVVIRIKKLVATASNSGIQNEKGNRWFNYLRKLVS